MNDIFALQDNIAKDVVSALAVRLSPGQNQHLTRRDTNNVDAYEHYLRGRALFGAITKQQNEVARRMYHRAIDLDPNFARAYAGLALTYVDDFRRRLGPRPEESVERAIELAKKAVELDNSLPQAHWVLGYVYLYGKAEHELAIKSAQRAIDLDPSYADAYALLGSGYFFSGNANEAMHFDEMAMRLNPAVGAIYWAHLGRNHYAQGRLSEALEAFQKSINSNPDYLETRLYLAATYNRLGLEDEATWEVDQILTLDPDFTLDKWRQKRFFESPEYLKLVTDELRKAGLS